MPGTPLVPGQGGYARKVQDTAAERDRLKVTNAELLAALEVLLTETKDALVSLFGDNPDDPFENQEAIKQARAVLAKAKESTS